MSKIKLGDVTKIRTGKLDANASSENGKYPFFTCSKDPLKIDSYSYDCECVLVAGNGDLNVKYYKGKFDAYQRTYIIEDNSKGRLFIPYLYYFLELYVEELRKQSIGGVIKYIKLGNLTEAIIELPSIQKQKEIVNILNKSRKIVVSKNMQLQEYDQLIKSRFVEMFGDIENNSKQYKKQFLKDICSIKTGGTPSRNHPEYFEGTIPWITTVALGKVEIDKSDATELITEDAVNNSSTKIIKMGSILFGTRVGVGKTSINKVDLCTNQDIAAITEISKDYDLIFLKMVLDSYSEYFNNQKRGATIQGITTDTLKNIYVPIIDLESQKEFSKFVKQVDKLKFVVQKSLDETQKLFDSLMQEYFG